MSSAVSNSNNGRARTQQTFKADSILIRVEELINLDQSEAALETLSSFLAQKRTRYLDPVAVEPVVTRLITLATTLHKGRSIREALTRFKRAYYDNVEGLKTLSAIIKTFVDDFMKALEEQESTLTAEQVEDICAITVTNDVTPFSVMYAASSKKNSNSVESSDDKLTPLINFAWEAYRSILDILCNNAHLEPTYSQISQRCLAFVSKYNMKDKFRRLNELLRNHLKDTVHYQYQLGTNPIVVNLKDLEVFQRFADQRFAQLKVCIKFELWHEAFKSIEDIHRLWKLNDAFKPRAIVLAAYYEGIAKTFLASSNYLINAYALTKFFDLYQTNPNATEEDFKHYASVIFMACLAVPEDELPTVGYDPQLRICGLLDLETKPTRKELFDFVLQEQFYQYVSPELKELYNILNNFNSSDIESLKKNLNSTVINTLSENPIYKGYLAPLRDYMIRKIYVALSETNNSIATEELFKAATLPAPFTLDQFDLFNSLIQVASDDYIFFTLDEENETVNFVHDPYQLIVETDVPSVEGEVDEEDEDDEETIVKEATEQGNEEEEIDHQPIHIKKVKRRMMYITNELSQNEKYNNASYTEKVRMIREKLISDEQRIIDQEQKSIEYSKREEEELLKKKQIEESEQAIIQREIRRKQEKEAEERLKIEEAERKEDEKKKKIEQDLQDKAVKLAIEKLNQAGFLKINPKDYKKYTVDKLKNLELDAMIKDRSEFEEKLPALFSKADYFHRAQLEVERPLLKERLDKIKKEDRARYEQLVAQLREQALEKHNKAVSLHELLNPSFDAFASMKQSIIEYRKEQFMKERQFKIDQLKKKLFLEKVEALKAAEEQEAAQRAAIEEAERAEREAQAAKQKKLDDLKAKREARLAEEEASRIEAAKKLQELEERERQQAAASAAAKPAPAAAAAAPSPASTPTPAAGSSLPARTADQSDDDRRAQVEAYISANKLTFAKAKALRKAEGIVKKRG
ncbi:hypothetical protein ACO0SA_003438 [Hanseniaspora valbyensis]